MVFYDIIITQKMENVKKGADLMEYSDIKKIIEDMGNSNLDNLEIEFPDGLKIKMEKDNKEKTVEKARKSIAKYGEEGLNRFDGWCSLFL